MNRYISVLERVVSSLPTHGSLERQTVYTRARRAVIETFQDQDNPHALTEELKLLEAAIEVVEYNLHNGKYDLPLPELAPDPEPLAPLYPEPEVQAQDEPRHDASVDLIAQTASPDETRADAASAAKSDDPIPGASLFAQNTGPTVDHRDREEPENHTPSKLQVALLLMLVAAAGYFALKQPPQNLIPDKPVLTTATPVESKIISNEIGRTQWALNGKSGPVIWSIETDRSSFAPRRRNRTVLVGRADLAPQAPALAMYFVPSADEGLHASHFLEFRFEPSERDDVANLRSLALIGADQSRADPEGVPIRTGPHSFAFVFSNATKDAPLNDALLRQTKGLEVIVLLEKGTVQTIVVETIELMTALEKSK